MKSAKDTAFELDINIGAISCQVETLFGVNDLLLNIVSELDGAVSRGEMMFPVYQIHRRLNAILDLHRYSLNDLEKYRKQAMENSETLFEHFIKE